jgi:ABC-type nitrate/sulfonate/bicarbonate transport system substrate-binding protein
MNDNRGRKNLKRFYGATRGVALTVLLLWTVRASAEPSRISYSAIASNTAGIWMAEGSGAFKKHGLDTQLVYISSSTTNVQALLGGSIDIMVGAIQASQLSPTEYARGFCHVRCNCIH